MDRIAEIKRQIAALEAELKELEAAEAAPKVKLTAAQEMTLRTIAANGGEMDGWRGQKGFRTASLPKLRVLGLVENLGTTKTADDREYVTYNRHRITPAGLAWIG